MGSWVIRATRIKRAQDWLYQNCHQKDTWQRNSIKIQCDWTSGKDSQNFISKCLTITFADDTKGEFAAKSWESKEIIQRKWARLEIKHDSAGQGAACRDGEMQTFSRDRNLERDTGWEQIGDELTMMKDLLLFQAAETSHPGGRGGNRQDAPMITKISFAHCKLDGTGGAHQEDQRGRGRRKWHPLWWTDLCCPLTCTAFPVWITRQVPPFPFTSAKFSESGIWQSLGLSIAGRSSYGKEGPHKFTKDMFFKKVLREHSIKSKWLAASLAVPNWFLAQRDVHWTLPILSS